MRLHEIMCVPATTRAAIAFRVLLALVAQATLNRRVTCSRLTRFSVKLGDDWCTTSARSGAYVRTSMYSESCRYSHQHHHRA